MKKIAALLLTVALLLSCVSALAETYFGNDVYCEAGYENDVYNGVAKVLHLYEDGTFELVDNTSIIHNSYKVVTNWAYIVTGTYTVDAEEDGVKEVTLTATAVTYIMNGSVTTSEEDAELLEDYVGIQFECDSESFMLKEI